MRIAHISSIPSVVIAWFVVGAFLPNPDEAPAEQPAPTRITLLGNSFASGSEAPSFSSFDSFETLQAMLVRLESATPAELKRWLLALGKSARATREIKLLIVSRLASEDPEGTYAFLKSNEPSLGYEPSLLLIALNEWIQRDLPAAIDASLKDRGVNPLLFASVSELNPEQSETA